MSIVGQVTAIKVMHLEGAFGVSYACKLLRVMEMKI